MTDKKGQDKIKDVIERCVENVIPSSDKLKKLLTSDKKLSVYLGIDPTSTRIHLGHAVPLRKLQILFDLGHKVTFLIGDFTATIGDTSDKEGERPVLTRREIEENFATYKRQAEKFLDFSKVKVVFNSDWLKKLTFSDVLSLAGHFSVNDFTSRELIRKRLDEGKRVSLPETLYPLMQGYDSYHLKTDIQLGGTDQTFNMQAGRKLIKILDKRDSFILANGFLPGTDGRKMSKTWGNAIWLDDSPEEMYVKTMSIKDDLIVDYFKFGTNLNLDEIEVIEKELKEENNPMGVKERLAEMIVTEMHGSETVKKAREHYVKTKKETTASESTRVDPIGYTSLATTSLPAEMVAWGTASSNSEAMRLIRQGGVYVNNKRVSLDSEEVDFSGKENVLRVGKKKYVKLIRG
jgi:tyrosyl-tRNA synthetase